MVVKQRVEPADLDLAYLGFFLGLRVNELVQKRLASRGFPAARQSHGYIIQHLIEGDRTITDLAHRMEVTQQAASKVVAQMVRLGILESVPGDDRRARNIRLSERGWKSVENARTARRTIEARFVRSIGQRKYGAAQKVLLKLLEELGGFPRIRSRRILEPR
jgi:DNA-binding MarR family transcriptional regulator